MKQLILAIAIAACVANLRAQGILPGDVTFAGNVYVTNVAPAPTSMSAAIASGGAWTNDGEYVWYRLAATNRHGQSAWVYTTNSVIVNVATGRQSATVTWTGGIPGASGYVLSRRTTTNSVADPAAVTNDASWPLWRGVAPYVASLTDVSSTNWQTNAWASLAAWNRTLVYPWATTADIDARVASGHVAYAAIAGTASNAPAYLPLAGATTSTGAIIRIPGTGDSAVMAGYGFYAPMVLVGTNYLAPAWGAGYDAVHDRYLIGPWDGAGIGGDGVGAPGYYYLQRWERTETETGPREVATTAAPAWQRVTNLVASIVVTNLVERPYYLYATGVVEVAFSGLRSPAPMWLSIQGPSSVSFATNPPTQIVGGGSWQTNRANHFLVWSYGATTFVNPVASSEEDEP